MLTIKELKEFIADFDDDVEVRVASVYDSGKEEYYHVEMDDITLSKDTEGEYLIVYPKEIGIE